MNEDIKQDADDAVRGFARFLRTKDETTGVPRPSRIDVSESSLDPVRFDFQLGRGTKAQASPGPGASPPPTPTCGPCTTWTGCPGGCSPPIGACVHYVSFQVMLTQTDIDNDYSELFDLGQSGFPAGHGLVVYADSGGFHLRGGGVSGDGMFCDISNTDVPLVECQCYDVIMALNDTGDPDFFDATLCVNGFTDSASVHKSAFAYETWDTVVFGDFFGGDAVDTRKYRNIVVSPGFDFDVDNFDSLTNASVLTEGGEKVLCVDSGASTGYGLKGISWVIACS